MKIFKTMSLPLMIVSSIAFAAPVGSQFTYQAQLQENGSPANGLYDFVIDLWDAETGGGVIGQILINDAVVTNGLFTAELDFGNAHFMGEDRYLSILVRNGSSTGGYTPLSPRQRINAVPYAIQSEFVENSSSPWQIVAGGISYLDDVTIGTLTSSSPSKVTIAADPGEEPLRLRVAGGTQFLVNASGKTEIGSLSSSSPSKVTIAAAPGEEALRLRIAGGTQFLVNGSGGVEIGSLSSSSPSKVTIASDSGEEPLRARIGGATRFLVTSNGGVAVGTNGATPLGGLYVEGDANQALTSHGFAKAGIRFACGNSSTTVFESFNNVNGDAITLTSNLPEAGRCELFFPFDYSSSYIQATATALNFPRGVSCGKTNNGTDDLIECNGYDPLSGLRTDIVVTLLLF